MEHATGALEKAGLTADDLHAGLEETRDEVTAEHYGDGYFERLREAAAARDGAGQK